MMTLLGRVSILIGVTILLTRLCRARLFRLPLHRRVMEFRLTSRLRIARVTVLTGRVLMHGTLLVRDMILGWDVMVNRVWTLDVATFTVCVVHVLTYGLSCDFATYLFLARSHYVRCG